MLGIFTLTLDGYLNFNQGAEVGSNAGVKVDIPLMQERQMQGSIHMGLSVPTTIAPTTSTSTSTTSTSTTTSSTSTSTTLKIIYGSFHDATANGWCDLDTGVCSVPSGLGACGHK